MAIKTIKLVADLETTTDPEDLRVWAVCAVNVDTLITEHLSNSLDSFFEFLKNKNTVCWFHNLKFDGEWLISWLLRNGYEHHRHGYIASQEGGREYRPPKANTFDTLITDTGAFYSITVIFSVENKKYKKVTFYDSLKKLPFKVAEIAKAFKLKDRKLSIDYDEYRAPGHMLTDEEKAYVVADCKIVAEALHIQMSEGLTKMTNASDAMTNYKDRITRQQFEYLFPVLPLELDDNIRKAYRGGFVYLNPEKKDYQGEGITFDVNSLYPSVMYNELLPYGYPYYFNGPPEDNERYPLYICRGWFDFDLKPGHIPTLQIKKNLMFKPTEYVSTSGGMPVELFLTNVDLALLRDHYEIHYEQIEEGWAFKGAKGLFHDYIDYWMDVKKKNKGAKRALAKLQLNSLYGRFALYPYAKKDVPYLDNDGVVRYKEDPECTPRDPVYTAMGCFITAWARNKTIRSAQAVYDRFIYADTDSLHITGHSIPNGLWVDPDELGAWKNEGYFIRSKYIRSKTYMETMTDVAPDTLYNYCVLLEEADWVRREHDGLHFEQTKVTCAGMPDNVKTLVTYDNFKQGSSFPGKLLPRRRAGGVYLEETCFTIR